MPHLDEVGGAGGGIRQAQSHAHGWFTDITPALGRLGLPLVRRIAEVDPTDLAEAVGVTGVGGHLLAGNEEDAV